VVEINKRLGHCITYEETFQIETAFAEATLLRSKISTILPIKPASPEEVILTYFWVDNFDVNIDNQTGGGAVNTTHLVAFQEAFSSNVTVETEHIQLPKSKRRKFEIDPTCDLPFILVDKNKEPDKFPCNPRPLLLPTKYETLFLTWILLRKWGSFDQTIPNLSGWLLQCRMKKIPKYSLKKTTETYLPPIPSKVTSFQTISSYFQYLSSLSDEVNMAYVNITLDVGAAMNAFKFMWNYKDKYDNVVIHLGDFHFMKEIFQV
jgi:hypothetical protein